MTKYGNVRTVYKDRSYHSKKEAAYAQTLDFLQLAGEIKSWEPQVRIPIVVDGVKVATYIADFRVLNADGSITIHECKGYQRTGDPVTRLWKLKVALLKATQNLDVEVV